jgi:transposase
MTFESADTVLSPVALPWRVLPRRGIRGVAWRDLPERFGPWQTVWKRHHRFATDGTWDMLLRVIQSEADAAGHPAGLRQRQPGGRVLAHTSLSLDDEPSP